jgi:uncharacterized protein
VPSLPKGAPDIRILHFSDLHLTPNRKKEIKFIKSWVTLKPDLVVSTGDFLAHRDAVETVLDSLDELLNLPGLYVFGSNDYYSPRFKNPLTYLGKNYGTHKLGAKLPTEVLESKLTRRGWINLNNRRTAISIRGLDIDVRGTNDAHLGLDDYSKIQGKPKSEFSIGVTHAPYDRVLDSMKRDGVELILAGHTHGGQIRFPGFRRSYAITTNCDLPNWRARGLTRIGSDPWLNVSAGVGYSPFVPFRIFCSSEVSIITLTNE